MIKFTKNVQIVVGIFFILIVLDGGLVGLRLMSSLSYGTGYQGARATFAGVLHDGKHYTNVEKHSASVARFDTTLHFDADGGYSGLPNLEGEMTSVFVPEQSLGNIPSWIPSDWGQSASYIQNPKTSWEWTISNKSYVMEEWVLRWYFTISAEWDNAPWIYEPNKEWDNSRYNNAEVWFEIDLTPVWYFEGAETAYFAIAKAQLSHNVDKSARDNNNKIVNARTDMSVNPESFASVLPIYYGLFAKSNSAQKSSSSYQGVELNPDLFTDKVYTYFTLTNFGTTSWVIPFGWEYKGDIATVGVDVHVFVVGQWDVQDVQDVDLEDYGRTAKVGGTDFFGGLFISPEGRLLGVLLAGLAVFLVLALFAPWVLVLIMSLLGLRRRK